MTDQSIKSSMKKIKKSWQTLLLGIGSLLVIPVLGVLATQFRRILDPESYREMPPASLSAPGFLAFIVSFVLSIWAIVSGIRALKTGERTWPVWVGVLLALLTGLFWIIMVAGEILLPH